MKKKRCFLYGCLAGAALALITTTGCQTNVAGMTLPSGHYLDNHPPQFIPPSPDFPLLRELSRQEEIAVVPAAGGGAVLPLPRQVPPGGAGIP